MFEKLPFYYAAVKSQETRHIPTELCCIYIQARKQIEVGIQGIGAPDYNHGIVSMHELHLHSEGFFFPSTKSTSVI